MDDSEFPVGVWDAAPRRVRWGAETAREILRRTEAGESMRSICRDEGMPAPHTVGRWATERPRFGEALLAARRAAGGPWRGGRTTFCDATAQAIIDRICEGEALISVCRDPDMPVAATVYRWRAQQPEFARALAQAFELRAEGFFERGWEIAEAATPETAYLARVKLGQLRWHVGKLAPKKYGALKPFAPPTPDPERVLHVYTKNYVLGSGGEPGRWSEEPARHLYSMVRRDGRGGGGEPLAPPAVVREPAATQGPDADWQARGGAVEAEFEGDGEDSGDDGLWG